MPPPVVHYVGFRRAMVGVDVPEQLTRSRSPVWPLAEHAQQAGDAGNPVSPPIFLQCKSLLLAQGCPVPTGPKWVRLLGSTGREYARQRVVRRGRV